MSKRSARPLTILHTSDWHLGRRLYGRRRYEEFTAFLEWLETTICQKNVDVLIVAGDIFDTMTPSNKAQALYYEFLGNVSKTCCQHIVIVAGNHDSPTFLDAPSQVLKFLNVHVIGTACEDISDEVLVLDDTDGTPQCILAAVPYLRDRDVRSSSAGESMDDKDANVINGIRNHYNDVARVAKDAQDALTDKHQRHIPIIATGHLFAIGGKTTDDDGVRDLYVGNLGKISADMFSPHFDYVALGHLHVPQKVGGHNHIRYSGSPIAMGFGEARQQKQVLLISFAQRHKDKEPLTRAPAALSSMQEDLFGFDDTKTDNATLDKEKTVISQEDEQDSMTDSMQVTSLPIPCFQKLAQITGDLDTIANTIKAINPNESVWLEVTYTGDELVNHLKEHINDLIVGSKCEVLLTKNPRHYNKVLGQKQSGESLQDLNELDVFERCLMINDIPETQKQPLLHAYQQILHDIHHDDSRAE